MPLISGSGGAVSAAAIEATFTAAGQVYQGTGAGTGALKSPPGFEIGYAQITASVDVVSTTEATGTTIISPGALTFDGAPVMVELFAYVRVDTAAVGDAVVLSLFEGVTQITRLAQPTTVVTTNATLYTLSARYRFTPTAASHTYTVTAFATSTTGVPSIRAQAGGTGAISPCFIRFTKV